MKAVVVVFFSSLFLAAFTKSARAACPNRCTLEVEDARLEPSIECVDLYTPGPQDCDCELKIHVFNRCTEAIVAQGFSFHRCGGGAEACAEIAPESEGSISEPLTEVGTIEHTFSIRVGDNAAEITAKTKVKSFDGGGCSQGLSPPGVPPLPWTALLLGAAGVGVARQRRLRSKMPLLKSTSAAD